MEVHILSDVNRYYVEPGKPCEIYAMFEVFHPQGQTGETLSIGRISGRPPARVCFCIDVSGSMNDEGKLSVAKSGVIKYLEWLEPTDYVAVVTFAKKAKVAVPMQPAVNRGEIARKVMSLKAEGHTNLYDGIRLAYAVVEGVEVEGGRSLLDRLLGRRAEQVQLPSKSSVKRIVLLTDGVPTIGVMDPENYRKIGFQFRRLGITVTAAGIGIEYDDKILEALSTSSGGIWRHVLASDELIRFFEESATEIRSVVIPNLELLISPSEGVQLIDAYRVGDAVTRIDIERTKEDGSVVIPFEDLRRDVKQRVVVKIRVPPEGAGKHVIARYTLAGPGFEKGGDLLVEATDDASLYGHETNPMPRMQFLLCEGTALTTKGLENKRFAEQALEEVTQLLSSPHVEMIRSDETLLYMSETIIRTASQILQQEELSPDLLKRLREETTVLKSRGGER